jgi:hypothetical protein
VAVPYPSPARAAGRPRFEVAEIFRAHGETWRARHAASSAERKAMWAIEHCRTEVLGGHVDVCLDCGVRTPSYNSCRNRHCPKCQALSQAEWLERRKARILPTHYFHVVFTLPEELRPLCRLYPAALYDLLFKSASQTLQDFGRGELSAQLGITCVLHTWTRDLKLHPHLHCVVTGGGLAPDGQWVAAKKRFLFSVHAMGKCFRGKFLDGLRALHAAGKLDSDADDLEFRNLIDALFRKDWVVYSKPPFGGPEQVFAYLGRYTHRVAISNHRLVRVDDHEVRFRTRDGNHASLTPEKFIGRFLLHLLPQGFVKIRHYGLWASSSGPRLAQARTALQNAPSAPTPVVPLSAAPAPTWRDLLLALIGIDLAVCPLCGGRRVRRTLLSVLPPRQRVDSS